jgi:hypothetical protein
VHVKLPVRNLKSERDLHLAHVVRLDYGLTHYQAFAGMDLSSEGSMNTKSSYQKLPSGLAPSSVHFMCSLVLTLITTCIAC